MRRWDSCIPQLYAIAAATLAVTTKAGTSDVYRTSVRALIQELVNSIRLLFSSAVSPTGATLS